MAVDVSLNRIDEPFILNMSAPTIRKKFPLSDRISLALCGCGKGKSPV